MPHRIMVLTVNNQHVIIISKLRKAVKGLDICLEGKVAVITGGTKGIGLAIAETIAKAGAKIAVCASTDVSPVAKLSALGHKAYGKVVNVSNRKSLSLFAQDVEKLYGGIDIWINNAGIAPRYKIIDTPEDVWDRVMNVNLKAVYYGALIASEHLRKRGGGVLLNAVSYAAIIPSIGTGVYAATKSAVYSLTRSLAGELAPYNIRVNGYVPGDIETGMMAEDLAECRGELVANIAQQRIGSPQDVANAVLYLVSDLSSYVTGTFIEITGGKLCVQNPLKAWN